MNLYTNVIVKECPMMDNAFIDFFNITSLIVIAIVTLHMSRRYKASEGTQNRFQKQ